MVKCADITCQSRSGSGHGMYGFPLNDKTRLTKWLVALNRAGSKPGSLWQPTKHSKLCSLHFNESEYVLSESFAKSIDYTGLARRKLRDSAVPSKFTWKVTTQPPARGAVEKRQRIANSEYCMDLCNGATQCDFPNDDTTDMTDLPNDDAMVSEGEQLETVEEDPGPVHIGIQATPHSMPVSCQTNWYMHQRCIGIQTMSPSSKTRGTQCDFPPMAACKAFMKTSCTQTDALPTMTSSNMSVQCQLIGEPLRSQEEDMDDESEDEDEDMEQADDPDYIPSDDECDEDSERIQFEDTCDERPEKMRKFIVFESCLRSLLAVCSFCLMPAKVGIKFIRGTLVVMQAKCENGHIRDWYSQPQSEKMPYGNLLCSGAILLSGCSPVKAINFMKSINIVTFSKNTYYRYQRLYVLPAISTSWEKKQGTMLQQLQGKEIVAGGDGRCCSPGHTATYGSYSVMDLNTSKILDTQLVKVTEVKNSYWLEIEGLKRSFAYLSTNGVKISTFVTDRHTQIKKLMKTEHKQMKHYFDVWHVGKGIKKKLEKLAKKKANRKLLSWIHSITNHLYWAAASSNGCAEECSQKWVSCVNHVADVHTGHGDIFTHCIHEELHDRDWLKKGSRLHKQVEEILTPKALMADIGNLSPGAQTYSLESFHKVLCFFAPKAVHFSYAAMKGRILLAVMHFNENSQRQQAKTKDGTDQWSVSYMKYGKGQPITKEVKTAITYGYVEDCLEELMKLRETLPSITQAAAEVEKLQPAPPNVTDQFERQDKDNVIAARKSRFRNMNFSSS